MALDRNARIIGATARATSRCIDRLCCVAQIPTLPGRKACRGSASWIPQAALRSFEGFRRRPRYSAAQQLRVFLQSRCVLWWHYTGSCVVVECGHQRCSRLILARPFPRTEFSTSLTHHGTIPQTLYEDNQGSPFRVRSCSDCSLCSQPQLASGENLHGRSTLTQKSTIGRKTTVPPADLAPGWPPGLGGRVVGHQGSAGIPPRRHRRVASQAQGVVQPSGAPPRPLRLTCSSTSPPTRRDTRFDSPVLPAEQPPSCCPRAVTRGR
jgi:hypothetical protein